MAGKMRKGRSSSLILCTNTEYLLAGIWNAGKLQVCRQFINDQSGYAAFDAFLKQHLFMPIYLIADALEEDYRLVHLPHTTGTSRHELVERKLNQFYRGLRYRTAHFAGRDSDKRQDDRFLFAAISNASFMEEWIAVIQQNAVSLVGVYLLSMISTWLIEESKSTSPHVLLCERLSSGLRQTYFHDGHLIISRLVSNMPVEAASVLDFYLAETEKMRLYLISKRLVSMETQLQVLTAGVEAFPHQLVQALSQEQGVECAALDTAALAKTLGLGVEDYLKNPELLHMQLLAGRRSADNLAPEELTGYYRRSRLKRQINLCTCAVAVLGTGLSAVILTEGVEHHKAYVRTLHDVAQEKYRYSEVAKHYPVTHVAAADLRQAVILDATIDKFPKSPRRMMQVLSDGLEQPSAVTMEHIQLQQLHWMLTNNSSIKDHDKMPSAIAMPAEDSRAVQASIPSQFAVAGLYEIGFLTAQINTPGGNDQVARNIVNQYVKNIKADGRVASVEVVQEPFNPGNGTVWQGNTAHARTSESLPIVFKLKIILKPAGSLPIAAAEIDRL